MRLDVRKRKNRKWFLAGGLLTAGIFAAAVLMNVFAVKEVTVEGNSRYTEEEIKELVLGKGYSNTLVLMAKSKYGGTQKIPFVSTLEVQAVSNSHVRIMVYEKTMIGYVEYMGTNLYFDKDGIVVESSSEVLEGIPRISGLKFSEVTLYEPLPVKDKSVFRLILSLTQSLDKNEVYPDEIRISPNKEITLLFNGAKVCLGNEELMDEKIANLSSFVEDLKERKGVLHMENFSEDTGNLVFDGDDG